MEHGSLAQVVEPMLFTALKGDRARVAELMGYHWHVAFAGDRERGDSPPLGAYGCPPEIQSAWRQVSPADLAEDFGVRVDGTRVQWFNFAWDDDTREAWCVWFLLPGQEPGFRPIW